MAIPLAPVELLDSAGTFATTHGPGYLSGKINGHPVHLKDICHVVLSQQGTDIIDAMTMDPEYAAQHRHQREQPIRGANFEFWSVKLLGSLYPPRKETDMMDAPFI